MGSGSKAQELTPGQLLERLGFDSAQLSTPVKDLSGGQQRRLQLLLDEPTNALDIETLNVLADFLDGWPGTLVVVSHDRYFLERVTDSVWALLGDGQISMLPGGVEEYLRRRAASLAAVPAPAAVAEPASSSAQKARPGSAEERAARKTLTRLDKQLERLAEQEATLNAAIAEAGQDYERLADLAAQLDAVSAQRDEVELEWLEAAELLE
jgi:ATP-binding cassette subfamily F protein uup